MSRTIPRTPLLLGAAGLIPFVVLAVMLWSLPAGYARLAVEWLLGYGAVILTFVGALHWGVAIAHPEMPHHQRNRLMAWSVVPALVAWVALAAPPLAAASVLAGMFVVQLVADHVLVRHVAVTPWFIHLRSRLTVVAVLCLLLTAAYLFTT